MIKQKNIASGVVINVAVTNVYTVPSSLLRTTIAQARVTNTGAAPATLNLWVLQPGDIAADKYKAIASRIIGVNETDMLPEIIGETIGANGIIQATSDLATSLNFSATGLEETS